MTATAEVEEVTTTTDLTLVEPLILSLPMRLEARVGNNSNLGHMAKAKLKASIQEVVAINVTSQINLNNEEALVKALLEPKNFPLVIICTRLYSSRSKAMDDDNLASCFKPYVDAICTTIGFSKIIQHKKKGPQVIPLDDPVHLKMVHEQFGIFGGDSLLSFKLMPLAQYEARDKAEAEFDKDMAGISRTLNEAGLTGEQSWKLRVATEVEKQKLSLYAAQVRDLAGNMYWAARNLRPMEYEQARMNTLIDRYNQTIRALKDDDKNEEVVIEQAKFA